jgi:hypothetical protein
LPVRAYRSIEIKRKIRKHCPLGHTPLDNIEEVERWKDGKMERWRDRERGNDGIPIGIGREMESR